MIVMICLVAMAYVYWSCCRVGAEEDERSGWK